MVVLEGLKFLMSEVPLYAVTCLMDVAGTLGHRVLTQFENNYFT